MIKQFILPLLAVLLLGSCANKFSLVKRKYNKGYYLDIAGKSSKQDNKQEKTVALNTKKINTVSDNKEALAEIKPSTIKTLPLVNLNEAQANNSPAKQTVKKNPALVTASANKNLINTRVNIKTLALKNAESKTSAAKGDSGVSKIILIILCFFPFINLIPVYIHDGNKLTLNFLVTLLLDLLFFIPGIIFALLVVLDVVNLA